jgi:hypothetical protein
MRPALVGLAAVLLLAAAAFAGEQALPRATADRPDEVVGPQVHVVYAVPSDGADRALDTSGAIENSVAAWTRWLAAETGGPTLRLDTSGGQLDVTFVRLPQTDAQIAGRGAQVRDELERLLRAAGLMQADKLYAVYYDGTSTYACGGGAWPPALRGQVAAMYLRGLPNGAIVHCDRNGLAGPGEPPRYIDIGMLHELVHTMGFVATCAPHHHRAGHVSDNANDLMWSGDTAWQLPPRLDIGRDDYYGHGRSDCADLSRSPYLTSNPPAPAPKPAPAPAPRLTAGSLVVGVVRAGRPLDVRLPLRLGGAAPRTATVRCTATTGRSRLAVTLARYSAGSARCRWTIPRTAAGKRVAGSVSARAGGTVAARSFTRVVRR